MHQTFFKQGKKKKKTKGKTAKFSTEVKTLICQRDKVCILSGEAGHSVHHVYFWVNSNKWDNRNDIDQGVLLSFDKHLEVHWCSNGEGARQECINYIKNYYETS